MSRVDFIFSTSDNKGRLIVDYGSTETVDPSSAVRMDRQVAYSVQPVIKNPPGSDTLYSPDFSSADQYLVTIGYPDKGPTGGAFALDAGGTTTGLTALSHAVTGAALQTPLSAAFVTEGEAACTVTLVATGIYKIVGNSNGAIASGFLSGTATNLSPSCSIQIIEKSLGSDSAPYSLLLVIRQLPFVSSEPTTLLPATDVSVTTIQAGGASTDRVLSVEFDVEQTYGGSFSVSAAIPNSSNVLVSAPVGNARPSFTADEFAALLAAHPLIFFRSAAGTADNISVYKDGASFIVSFIGVLGRSALPSLTVANINLVGATGRSGVLDFDTIELYEYSLTQASQFEVPMTIKRVRENGERRTVFGPANLTIYNSMTGFSSDDESASFSFDNNTVRFDSELITWDSN